MKQKQIIKEYVFQESKNLLGGIIIKKYGKKMLYTMAVFILLVSLFAMVVYAGSEPGTYVRDIEIEHDGHTRYYSYYLPSSYDGTESYPVVMMFHGGGANSERFLSGERPEMDIRAETYDFILVCPMGWAPDPNDPDSGYWNDGRGTTPAEDEGIDDVSFTSALIADLVNGEELNIDPDRIYAAGASNGGFMVQRLAMELSDEIAAFASFIATIPTRMVDDEFDAEFTPPVPLRAATVMFILGTDDGFVPYNGGWMTGGGYGGHILSAQEAVDYWVDINNCNAQPTVTAMGGPTLRDPTEVTRYVYDDGDDSTKVILYKVDDGGHCWHGGGKQGFIERLLVGRSTTHIDSGDEMWSWFANILLP